MGGEIDIRELIFAKDFVEVGMDLSEAVVACFFVSDIVAVRRGMESTGSSTGGTVPVDRRRRATEDRRCVREDSAM